MNRYGKRMQAVLAFFDTHSPHAPQTELHYNSPFGLLVSVVLSAQCTDIRVNKVAPKLLEKYPTPSKMAQATTADLFDLIRSISYPNSKAKHLLATAKILSNQHQSQIPQNPEELIKLPGVGRKTAHVVAAELYNAPLLAVDTHVFRVAHRLGLVEPTASTPLSVEKTLMKALHAQSNYQPDMVRNLHHWLILHGRYVCLARKPQCATCDLQALCPYYAQQQVISN